MIILLSIQVLHLSISFDFQNLHVHVSNGKLGVEFPIVFKLGVDELEANNVGLLQSLIVYYVGELGGP